MNKHTNEALLDRHTLHTIINNWARVNNQMHEHTNIHIVITEQFNILKDTDTLSSAVSEY